MESKLIGSNKTISPLIPPKMTPVKTIPPLIPPLKTPIKVMTPLKVMTPVKVMTRRRETPICIFLILD